MPTPDTGSPAAVDTACDDLPDVCFSVAADGSWALLSAAWSTLTGVPRDARLRSDCLADVIPEDREAARAVLVNASPAAGAAVRDVRGAFRVRTAMGSLIAFEAHGRQRWADDGRPLPTRGILREVVGMTARVAPAGAPEPPAAHDARLRLRAIAIGGAPGSPGADGPDGPHGPTPGPAVGYWILDELRGHLSWDDTCAELFGSRPQSMPRDSAGWIARIHAADRSRVLAAYQQWKRQQFPDSTFPAYRVATDEGEWRWVQSRRSVIEWSADGLPALVGGSLWQSSPAFAADLLTPDLGLCAWCKKVRSGRGPWQSIEDYFADHLHMTFSHGMCTDCAGRLTGDE